MTQKISLANCEGFHPQSVRSLESQHELVDRTMGFHFETYGGCAGRLQSPLPLSRLSHGHTGL